jgi:hypothetical protein
VARGRGGACRPGSGARPGALLPMVVSPPSLVRVDRARVTAADAALSRQVSLPCMARPDSAHKNAFPSVVAGSRACSIHGSDIADLKFQPRAPGGGAGARIGIRGSRVCRATTTASRAAKTCKTHDPARLYARGRRGADVGRGPKRPFRSRTASQVEAHVLVDRRARPRARRREDAQPAHGGTRHDAVGTVLIIGRDVCPADQHVDRHAVGSGPPLHRPGGVAPRCGTALRSGTARSSGVVELAGDGPEDESRRLGGLAAELLALLLLEGLH